MNMGGRLRCVQRGPKAWRAAYGAGRAACGPDPLTACWKALVARISRGLVKSRTRQGPARNARERRRRQAASSAVGLGERLRVIRNGRLGWCARYGVGRDAASLDPILAAYYAIVKRIRFGAGRAMPQRVVEWRGARQDRRNDVEVHRYLLLRDEERIEEVLELYEGD